MQLLRHNPYMAGLLVLLLTLKFLLLPVIEWQDETLWSIKQNEKRVSRAENATTNLSKNQEQVSQIRAQLKQVQSLFYPAKKEASFKLEQQQFIESLLAKYDFKVSNVGWTYSAKMLDQPLVKHQLSVSFSGKTADLPGLFLAFDNHPQWIDVLNFSFNLIGQKATQLGQFRGSLDIIFYQLAEATNSAEQGQSDES